MFIGHYAVALAAKRVAPRTSLGTLFLAVQLADMLWPIFLLLGWEHAHFEAGPNPFLVLWLDSIPISHSLLTLIAWGALFAGLYHWRTGYARGALVVALAVVSHWVLDFATHRPDMPLYPGGPKLGLGLWNSVAGTIVVEAAMFLVGLWMYLRATRARDAVGRYGLPRSSPCSYSPTSARSWGVRRRACARSRSAGSASGGCSWRGRRGGINTGKPLYDAMTPRYELCRLVQRTVVASYNGST